MAKITVTYEFDNEDELRAHFGADAVVRAAPVATPSTPTPPAPEPAPEPEPEPVPVAAEPEVTDEVDADGMPWDPEFHATPKSFVGKGLWRAKRGKKDEADAERAKFKAAGGAVTAPVVEEAPVATATMPAPAVMPSVSSEPVSMDEVAQKTHDLMEAKVLSMEQYTDTLTLVGASSADDLTTNETMRAAYYDKIIALEAA